MLCNHQFWAERKKKSFIWLRLRKVEGKKEVCPFLLFEDNPWGHKQLDMTEWLNWLIDWPKTVYNVSLDARDLVSCWALEIFVSILFLFGISYSIPTFNDNLFLDTNFRKTLWWGYGVTHTFDNEDYTFEVFLEFFLVSRKLNMKLNILS